MPAVDRKVSNPIFFITLPILTFNNGFLIPALIFSRMAVEVSHTPSSDELGKL